MRRKQGASTPTPVGKILKTLLDKLQLEGRVTKESIYQLWPQVVGDELARHSWPATFRGKVLTIGAEDSLWTQKLSLMRLQILERIAQELGPGLFDELRFQVSPPPQK